MTCWSTYFPPIDGEAYDRLVAAHIREERNAATLARLAAKGAFLSKGLAVVVGACVWTLVALPGSHVLITWFFLALLVLAVREMLITVRATLMTRLALTLAEPSP